MQMIATRLHQGDDLKASIESFVAEQKLASATIISAVGSLSDVRMRMAGAQPDVQDVRDYTGPHEIVSLIGNLGSGRTHLHIAVSNSEGAVIGGHLKEGTLVHTTVELVLATDPTVQFAEETDPHTGFGELKITRL
jgi:predicted DNA-binding protein with PD1-like motif